jgi:hypothetical protein
VDRQRGLRSQPRHCIDHRASDLWRIDQSALSASTDGAVHPAPVSYGSFNTLLIDGQYNTGMLGANKNIAVSLDVHRMTSDGFQTFNYVNSQCRRNQGAVQPVGKHDHHRIQRCVRLFDNAPNVSPYRAQIDAYGWNYMMENNDPTSAFYQAYNTNTVPTDFEYVAFAFLAEARLAYGCDALHLQL